MVTIKNPHELEHSPESYRKLAAFLVAFVNRSVPMIGVDEQEYVSALAAIDRGDRLPLQMRSNETGHICVERFKI